MNQSRPAWRAQLLWFAMLMPLLEAERAAETQVPCRLAFSAALTP
jgi:hypothetical protein